MPTRWKVDQFESEVVDGRLSPKATTALLFLWPQIVREHNAHEAMREALEQAERRMKCYERWISDKRLASVQLSKTEEMVLDDIRVQLPDLQAALTLAKGE